MSKLLNSLSIISIVVLSSISCSILSPKVHYIDPVDSAESVEPTISTQDDLAEERAVLDSLSLVLDSLRREVSSYREEPAQEEVAAIEEMEEDDEIDTHELFSFHFEGSETSAVMIDEFRNSVVEDMVINLGEWDSHYPADGHVTSSYGWRRNRTHAGIDLKAYTGDNLYAAFDGVVRLSKYYSSFGNCVIIRHYNGLETLYAHASKRFVEVNDVVKAGDVIALAGNTGRSTGSHLHFEVRVGGHHFNPTNILDTQNRKIKDGNLYITMRNGRLFASNNDSELEREEYILQQISIRYHTVKSGDTLSRIAVNNGTTVTNLCRLNGISSKSILRVGQRLIVRDGIKPTTKSTTSQTSQAQATEKASATTATPESKASSTSSSNGGTIIYRVKKGDTLSSIARNNGTSVSDLCSVNGITSRTTLQIGQKLKIPSRYASTTTASSSESGSSATEYYSVKKGDTLSSIARSNGTTVSEICSLNGITSRTTLQIGQKLKVPSNSASSTASSSKSSSSTPEYYRVKSGDTLSSIAKKHSTSVSKICNLNGIKSTSTLQINQKLRVR